MYHLCIHATYINQQRQMFMLKSGLYFCSKLNIAEDNSLTWGPATQSGCDIADSSLHSEVVQPLWPVLHFTHSLKSFITFWICLLGIGNVDEDIYTKHPGSYICTDNRGRLSVMPPMKAITTPPGIIKSPGLLQENNKQQYTHFHCLGHWFDLSCSSLSLPWNIKQAAQSLSSLEKCYILRKANNKASRQLGTINTQTALCDLMSVLKDFKDQVHTKNAFWYDAENKQRFLSRKLLDTYQLNYTYWNCLFWTKYLQRVQDLCPVLHSPHMHFMERWRQIRNQPPWTQNGWK